MAYLKYGPSGGVGGDIFDPIIPQDQKPGWKIREIKVTSESLINQIQLEWENKKNEIQDSPVIGSYDGGNKDEFDIVSDDYLVIVKGSVVQGDSGAIYVSSLQFTTNTGITSPIFGNPTSEVFSYQAPPGFQIIGIFGRAGGFIDALGVYINNI